MNNREKCVFCEIVEHDQEKQIIERISTVIEPIDVIVIEPYNPCVEGHLLFIPTLHVEDMRGPDATVSAAVAYAVSTYAKRRENVSTDFNLIVNNGSVAGQTVPHMHFHYLPRVNGDGVKLPWDLKD